MNRILIATLPGGHFWSYGPSWTNVNIDLLVSGISSLGYRVVVVEITEIMDFTLQADDIVIYTSSDNSELRQYIKDVIYILSGRCRVVPGYEALLAHENKGFQQLYRKSLGFGCLDGAYGAGVELLDAPTPYVFKLIAGAGSSGVELVRTEEDKRRLARKYFSMSIRQRLIDAYRGLTLGADDYARYKRRKASYKACVAQEFVTGLDCDFKVLVFGDRFFVLRRGVREKDFRASGSGNFTFDSPPREVLDFAHSVHQYLNTPYSSLDIALSGSGNPSLLEYQCISFGPYTVIGSPGYYFKGENGWGYCEGRTTLEDAIVYGIGQFLRERRPEGA